MRDREVVNFDGRMLVLRQVDPETAGRYGTSVYVPWRPRNGGGQAQGGLANALLSER